MSYDYINFSCTLSTVYGTPGLYATLTDCENAVNDGSAKPVLILNPLWSASKKASLPLLINKLGDGYQQTVFQGVDQISEEWSITSPALIGTQVNDLLNQLRPLSTYSFLWSPNNGVIDYKEFTCDEWQKIRVGVNQYQLTTTFKMSALGGDVVEKTRVTFADGEVKDFPAPITVEVGYKFPANVAWWERWYVVYYRMKWLGYPNIFNVLSIVRSPIRGFRSSTRITCVEALCSGTWWNETSESWQNLGTFTSVGGLMEWYTIDSIVPAFPDNKNTNVFEIKVFNRVGNLLYSKPQDTPNYSVN